MSGAYYNEIDPHAAQWLRNLIQKGLIADGDVDTRSIVDVRPADLTGYDQCHFFAGIGVWSHALRAAGWPDSRPVWTGSCPCQPFSAAGQSGGFDDERHLWPAFFHLIEECRPATLFGEQVASKDGLTWLDLVQSDLEGALYAVAALDLCAAGFGAPHIRQRLYWTAATARDGWRQIGKDDCGSFGGSRAQGRPAGLARSSSVVVLGDDDDERSQRHSGHGDGTSGRSLSTGSTRPASAVDELADASDRQFSEPGRRPQVRNGYGSDRSNAPTGPVNGVWRDADWLLCRDGKWRPVRSGTFPLAHGAPARVGRLRAYGNAIVAAQATEFIAAAMGGVTP